MVIRILDHVPSASSYADGEVIFRLLAHEIGTGNTVTASFDGIGSVPSAFINGAFVRLLEKFSFDEIRQKLRIADSTRYVNELIRSRFEFVTKGSTAEPIVPNGIYRVRFEGGQESGGGMVVIKGNTVNGSDDGYAFRGRIYGTDNGVAADLHVTRWDKRWISLFGDLEEFDLALLGTSDMRSRSFDVGGSVRGRPENKIRVVGTFVSPLES